MMEPSIVSRWGSRARFSLPMSDSAEQSRTTRRQAEKLWHNPPMTACNCQKKHESLREHETSTRAPSAPRTKVRGRLEYLMLFDPQTSGGLLAAVPQAQAEACALRQQDCPGNFKMP